jgi:fibronectin type 3 domain-containing protein
MPRSPLIRCTLFAALALAAAQPAVAATVPGSPVGVTASAGLPAEIDLSWGAPTPDMTVASVAATYIVQRGFSPTGGFATIFTTADATQTTFRDLNVPGNVNYYYQVVAVNSTGGQSPPSAPVKGTTAISTINDLGATGGVTTTSLPMAWSFVAGAGGYQVYKGVQGGPYTLVASVTGLVHTYVARSLTPGTPYAFVVKSRNGTAWSNYSNELVYATLPDIPTGLTATAGTSGIVLTWNAAPAQTAILSYRIYRSATTGGPYTQIGTVAGNVNTFPDNPGAGQRYYYVIDATSVAGASAKSAEATSVTSAAAITDLLATSSAGQVQLSWSLISGASSYNVYRNDGAGYVLVGSSVTGGYTDKQAPAGGSVKYVVRPVNSANMEGSNSNEVSATIAAAAPTGLVAAYSSGAINLTWNTAAGATSYSVQRSTKAGGPYTEIGTSNGASFSDTAVTSGGSYYYVIVAKNAGGSSPASAEAGITLAPAAPGNVTATSTDTAVSLSWAPALGATGYVISRSTTPGGPYTQVAGGSTTLTSFTDTNVLPGTTYFYVIKATNGGPTQSPPSPEVSVVTAIPAPVLTATPNGTGKLNISWTAIAQATSYKLQRSVGGGAFTDLYSTSGTSFSDAGLTNGTSYTYRVMAMNSLVSSAPSAPVTATTLLPAPTGVAASQNGIGSLSITWSPPSGASSFVVQRSLDGLNFTDLASTQLTSYADNTVAGGTSYTYRVVAVNGSATSAPSASATATSLLAAPTGLALSVGAPGNLTLTWVGAPNAVGYNVFRSTDGGSTWAGAGATLDPTWTFTDTNLAKGKAFTYAVQAVRGTVTSAFSATVSGATSLDAPGNLQATVSTFDISLTWTASAGATTYDVLRSTSANSGFVVIATNLVDTTYCNCGSSGAVRSPNTTYYYQVVARTSAATSAPATTSATTVFAAPTGLAVANSGRTSLVVTWSAVVGATKYSVQRATAVGGPYIEIAQPVDSTYTDAGLPFSTTYFYQVLAVSGSGPGPSSAPVSGTTQGSPWTPASGLNGGEITSLAFDTASNGSTVYASARGGAGVFKSTDGGATWAGAGKGLGTAAVSALGFGAGGLYAGTYGGGLFLSTDGAATWAVEPGVPASESILSVVVHGDGMVYAASARALYAKINGLWRATAYTGSAPLTGLAVDPTTASATTSSKSNVVYVSTDGAGVLKSTDFGQTWTPSGLAGASLQGGLAIDTLNTQRLWAGGAGGVQVTTDGGTTWAAAGSLSMVRSLAFSGGFIHAGTNGSGVFRSNNGGTTWSAIGGAASTVGGIVAMAASGTKLLAAAYNGAGIYSSTSGANFTVSNAGVTAADLTAVAQSKSNTAVLYAVAGYQFVKSVDHGATWTPNAALGYPVVATSLVVDPSDANIAYVGIGGIKRTTNGGTSWTSTGANFVPSGLAISAALPTTLYASVYNGGVYSWSSLTNTWTKGVTGLSDLRLHTVAVDQANAQRVYAGGEGGFFRSTDGGATWAPSTTSLSFVRSITVVSSTVVFAVVGSGASSMLQKSTDGGVTFTAVGFGSASVQNLVSLVADSTATTLYAAGSSSNGSAGGLYKSADGGATWASVSAGVTSARLRKVLVDPVAAGSVFVATQDSGLLVTSTAGL